MLETPKNLYMKQGTLYENQQCSTGSSPEEYLHPGKIYLPIHLCLCKIGWTRSFCSFTICGAFTISAVKMQTSLGTSVTDCCIDLLILLFLLPFHHLCRRKPFESQGMQIPGQEHCTKLTALYDQKDLRSQPSWGGSRTSTKGCSTSPSSLGKKCRMRLAWELAFLLPSTSSAAQVVECPFNVRQPLKKH